MPGKGGSSIQINSKTMSHVCVWVECICFGGLGIGQTGVDRCESKRRTKWREMRLREQAMGRDGRLRLGERLVRDMD